MARIILNTFGSYGDLFPFLAIAQRLQVRGHDPVIAAPEVYRSSCDGAGIEFVPVGPEVDFQDAETFRRAMDQRRGAEVIVREIVVPKLRESYHQLEAASENCELLVSHMLTYAAPILGEKKRIPWVATALQPMGFASAHDPPALAPIPWFASLRVFGPAFVGALWRILMKFSWSWSEPIRAFRQELGLAPGGDHLWGDFESADAVLALYSEAYSPLQPDCPERTTICGFPFHDSDFGGAADTGPLRKFLSEGPPPVVFSLGSSAIHCAENFYETASDAVQRSGHRAVLVTGDAPVPDDLPPEVLAIRSAAVHSLFEAASVVVHAGGIGTVGQAMRAARPQVVVPFSADHFDNAVRVKRIGVGESLNRRRFTARKLARVLAGITADDGVRTTAELLAQRIRAEDGADAACRALERTLEVRQNS